MSAAFSAFAPPSLASLGAVYTIPEILGQPDLWVATWKELCRKENSLGTFLGGAFLDSGLEVVLTGAGSSAYIGELLQGYYSRRLKRFVRAIPTTDIVTNPEECFAQNAPTLLISFARSGNSPESIAAIDRADECLSKVWHLIITCNPSGDLANHPTRRPRAVFILPQGADDRGLAMTGSFTSMALAGLLMVDLGRLKDQETRIRFLAAAAERLISTEGDRFRELARLGAKRAIFLGAGALKGAARESQLKIQELTNGSVMCSDDSFLGFRHGPKAALDATTLLIFLFSGRPGQRAYELDLVNEIRVADLGLFRLGVGPGLAPHESREATIRLDEEGLLEDEERAICGVLVAQILGVELSIAQGLSPDNPSPTGSISRVVQGVTIYPLVHDAR